MREKNGISLQYSILPMVFSVVFSRTQVTFLGLLGMQLHEGRAPAAGLRISASSGYSEMPSHFFHFLSRLLLFYYGSIPRTGKRGRQIHVLIGNQFRKALLEGTAVGDSSNWSDIAILQSVEGDCSSCSYNAVLFRDL